MKQIAEAYLGNEIHDAVIIVPAYFNNAQKSAAKDAGSIAGFNVVRVLNELTVAAIAYGMDKKRRRKACFSVQFRNDTLDISLMSIDKRVYEVLATSGDAHLGKGNRKAKRHFSSFHETTIVKENIIEKVDFSETLNRAKLEDLNNDLFKETTNPIEIVLEDAGLNKYDVYQIVLVGGSTRISKIHQLVKYFYYDKEPHRGINPDETIAYAAAIQAGNIVGLDQNECEPIIIDGTPLTICIETVGVVMTTLIEVQPFLPGNLKFFRPIKINKQFCLFKCMKENGQRQRISTNWLV